MKIIGLAASPRQKGNTAWVIDKMLEGAKEQGAETAAWSFSRLDINPCVSCYACQQQDGCVIDDDMQKLYTAIKDADVIILGTPVYMGQMSAQAKMFTDRLFANFHPRFSPHYKNENSGKKLVLVFTQGNPDAGMFQTYFDYTKKMFELLEFDVKGVYVAAGMRNAPASGREDLTDVMKNAGSSLVIQ